MSTRSFQLEKKTGDEHWSSVRCYEEHAIPCMGPFERFELSEPVWVDGDSLRAPFSKEKVFWITRIVDSEHDEQGPQVWLNFVRYGGHGDVSVCPTELRKLPAMLRLAHEADLP